MWVVVIIVIAVVEAWFPFRPDVPFIRRHPPVVALDGTISFDGRAALVAGDGQPWIDNLLRNQRLEVRLRARSADPQQDGPARLLSISERTTVIDLMIGQEREDLVVRIRRPGANWMGQPPIRVDGVFTDDVWHTIELHADRTGLDVTVDDEVRATEAFPAGTEDPFDSWDPSHRTALGDEARGDRGWDGSLAEATVQGYDLLRDQYLHGADGTVWADRLDHLWRARPIDPLPVSAVRVAAWAVLGVAVMRTTRRGSHQERRAVMAALPLPLVLTAGKIFVRARDPMLADALLGSAGVVAGLLIGRRLRSPTATRRATTTPA